MFIQQHSPCRAVLPTTIDGICCTAHELRFVTQQPCDQIAAFLRSSQAVDRRWVVGIVDAFKGVALVHQWCLDRTTRFISVSIKSYEERIDRLKGSKNLRRHSVHPNLPLANLLRRTLHQPQNPMLARRIRSMLREPQRPLHRTHAHNTPRPLHRRKLRPHTIHHPRKINPNNKLPLLILQLLHAPRAMVLPNHTRAVRRSIKSAELVDYSGNPVVDRRALDRKSVV